MPLIAVITTSKQPPTGSPHPKGVCTLDSFPLPSLKCNTGLRAPPGECTLNSFSLPSVEYKRWFTGFPHPNLRADPQTNVPLIVSLHQVRTQTPTYGLPHLTDICTPDSFPLLARNTNSSRRTNEI